MPLPITKQYDSMQNNQQNNYYTAGLNSFIILSSVLSAAMTGFYALHYSANHLWNDEYKGENVDNVTVYGKILFDGDSIFSTFVAWLIVLSTFALNTMISYLTLEPALKQYHETINDLVIGGYNLSLSCYRRAFQHLEPVATSRSKDLSLLGTKTFALVFFGLFYTIISYTLSTDLLDKLLSTKSNNPAYVWLPAWVACLTIIIALGASRQYAGYKYLTKPIKPIPITVRLIRNFFFSEKDKAITTLKKLASDIYYNAYDNPRAVHALAKIIRNKQANADNVVAAIESLFGEPETEKVFEQANERTHSKDNEANDTLSESLLLKAEPGIKPLERSFVFSFIESTWRLAAICSYMIFMPLAIKFLVKLQDPSGVDDHKYYRNPIYIFIGTIISLSSVITYDYIQPQIAIVTYHLYKDIHHHNYDLAKRLPLFGIDYANFFSACLTLICFAPPLASAWNFSDTGETIATSGKFFGITQSVTLKSILWLVGAMGSGGLNLWAFARVILRFSSPRNNNDKNTFHDLEDIINYLNDCPPHLNTETSNSQINHDLETPSNDNSQNTGSYYLNRKKLHDLESNIYSEAADTRTFFGISQYCKPIHQYFCRNNICAL